MVSLKARAEQLYYQGFHGPSELPIESFVKEIEQAVAAERECELDLDDLEMAVAAERERCKVELDDALQAADVLRDEVKRLQAAVAAERERIATKFVVWAGVHAVPFKAAMDFAAAIRKGE